MYAVKNLIDNYRLYVVINGYKRFLKYTCKLYIVYYLTKGMLYFGQACKMVHSIGDISVSTCITPAGTHLIFQICAGKYFIGIYNILSYTKKQFTTSTFFLGFVQMLYDKSIRNSLFTEVISHQTPP